MARNDQTIYPNLLHTTQHGLDALVPHHRTFDAILDFMPFGFVYVAFVTRIILWLWQLFLQYFLMLLVEFDSGDQGAYIPNFVTPPENTRNGIVTLCQTFGTPVFEPYIIRSLLGVQFYAFVVLSVFTRDMIGYVSTKNNVCWLMLKNKTMDA